MQQQLKTVPLVNVKVDVTAGVVKNNSMNWFIHAWHALQASLSMDLRKVVFMMLLPK